MEIRKVVATAMAHEEIAVSKQSPAGLLNNQVPSARSQESVVPANTSASVNEQPSVEPSGTGLFITPDGYLLTNFHVVEGATRIYVRKKQEMLEARLVTEDAANDLALLKVPGTFTALPLARSRTVMLGDSICTIGYPNPEIQGVEPKLTRGEINGLAGMQDDPRYFQISAPVQPGSSGGPLVDQDGNVVGIVTLRLDDLKALSATGLLPQNVNYAVKGSFAVAFVETVPEVVPKLREPSFGSGRKQDSIIREAQDAIGQIMVLRQRAPALSQGSLRDIIASLDSRNYVKAERLSREWLKVDPENIAALYFLGFSLYKMARFDEAISVLQTTGFIAPRNQSAFSCMAGRVLSLCHNSRWLSSQGIGDFQKATESLQSTLDCPIDCGEPCEQNPVAQQLAASPAELAIAQAQALDRLSDVTGTWLSVDSNGQQTRVEYALQLTEGRLTIKRFYKPQGMMGYFSIDAVLTKNGSRFVGVGKEDVLMVSEDCRLEFEISLELSANLMDLVGTRRYLKRSGSKGLCQAALSGPLSFHLRRK